MGAAEGRELGAGLWRDGVNGWFWEVVNRVNGVGFENVMTCEDVGM